MPNESPVLPVKSSLPLPVHTVKSDDAPSTTFPSAVSFTHLFRYATKQDLLFMAFGLLCAAAFNREIGLPINHNCFWRCYQCIYSMDRGASYTRLPKPPHTSTTNGCYQNPCHILLLAWTRNIYHNLHIHGGLCFIGRKDHLPNPTRIFKGSVKTGYSLVR